MNVHLRKQILKKCFYWKFTVPYKAYSLTSVIHSLVVQPHMQIVMLFDQPKLAKSASEVLSLYTTFNKIARIFLPFTTEKRSQMKHEKPEGRQPIFGKKKNRTVNAQAVLSTLLNSVSLVIGKVII